MNSILACVSVCIVFNVLVNVECANMYTKEANEGKQFGENPFKMMKTNLLWKKASKRISDKEKLDDLYYELLTHDKYEAEVKKFVAEGLDKTGEKASFLQNNYQRILKIYLPEHVAVDESKVNNNIPVEESSNLIDDKKNHDDDEKEFQDPELQSLWEKAKEGYLSEEDFEILRKELEYDEMKFNELDTLHKELYGDDDEGPITFMTTKDKLADEKHKKMKYDDSDFDLPPVFQDARVQKLWAMSKKANWTVEEKESFLEELRYFETRVIKHNDYIYKMKAMQEAMEGSQEELEEKHELLAEEADRLEKKITKIHSDLKDYVEQAVKHVEL